MDDKGGKSSNDANGSSFIQTSSKETTMKVTGNAKWDAMYHHLISYKKKHNDCLVPNRYKLMPQLGSWVSTQRRHYKQKQIGKDTPLTQERLDLLSKIGFVWATKDPRHVPWEQRFKELLAFKNKHGHCLIPANFEENPQLANWVSTQRQEWKLFKSKRPSRLTEERISLLNEAGFIWEAQRGFKKKKTRDSCYHDNLVEMKSAKQLDTGEREPKKREKKMSKEQSDRPWIAMFKEYLWYLDQKLSPEEIPCLKQWADEQRKEHGKQVRIKDGRTTILEGVSNLTMDQFKLLQSIQFDWKLNILQDTVENCPSAESEINENGERSSPKDMKRSTSPCGEIICTKKRSSLISQKAGLDIEVDAAETLFSMKARNIK